MKRTVRGRRVVLLLASALQLLAEEDSSEPMAPIDAHAVELDLGITSVVGLKERPNQDDLLTSSPDKLHVAEESADDSTLAIDHWDTILLRHRLVHYPDSGPHQQQNMGRDSTSAPKYRPSTRKSLTSTNFEPWPDWMAADYYEVEHTFFPFFAFQDDSDDHEEFNLIAAEPLNASQTIEFMKNSTDNFVVEPIIDTKEGVVNVVEDNATVKADHSYQFTNTTTTETNPRAAQSMDKETDKDLDVVDGDLELGEENEDTQQSNASEATDDQVDDASDPETTNQTDTLAEIEATPPIAETVPSSDDDQTKLKHVAVDYASKAVGALILDSSPNFQGASNLLQKDNDKYAIVPCDEESKYVVIGLSEDILVKQIVLSNFERYSSHMKEIHLSGSTTTALGSKDWVDLGTYVTTPVSGGFRKQTFDLKEPTWARYLRFEFLSHYGDEYYCTVSQISVHGSTMVQGFHEQWAELESVQESEEDVASITESDTSILSDETVLDNGSNNAALLADTVPDDDSVPLNEEVADAVDLQRANTGAVRQFPQTFRNCFSQTGLSCPASQDFEHFLWNASGYDALSSASICLSSSLRATSNQSFLETDRLRLRNWSGERKSDYGRVNSARLPRVSSGSFGMGYISNSLEKPSPVVERIKEIIRQTANAVNMEAIGSSLLRSLPVRYEPDSNNRIDSSAKPAELTREDEEVQQEPPHPTASKSESAVDKGMELDISDTNQSLARLLQRLPSSKCLDKLEFASFKKDFLALRSKGNGHHEKSHPSGVPMEPIFKKLTDEIKALQANVAVHDQFAKEYMLCYQNVLLDVLTEMESLRAVHDARISKLENDFYVGPWLATIYRVLAGFLLWMWQPAVRVLPTLLKESAKVQDTLASTAIVIVLLTLYLWSRRRMNNSSWLSRRIQKQHESELENRHRPATPQRDDTKPILQSQGSPSSVATLSPEHSVASSSHSAGRKKLSSNGGQRKRRPLAGRLFVK